MVARSLLVAALLTDGREGGPPCPAPRTGLAQGADLVQGSAHSLPRSRPEIGNRVFGTEKGFRKLGFRVLGRFLSSTMKDFENYI